jgi:RNA polymerase sigma factor (sigma-70 family)
MLVLDGYCPMARKMAWKAVRLYRIPFDDAYSDALFGLVRAGARCKREARFGGYARKCIQGAILDGIRNRAPVRNDSAYLRDHGRQPVIVQVTEDGGGDYEVDLTQGLENGDLWATVDRVLSKRACYIVKATHQRDMSQTVIARILGTSQSDVSRILLRSYADLAGELRPA